MRLVHIWPFIVYEIEEGENPDIEDFFRCFREQSKNFSLTKEDLCDLRNYYSDLQKSMNMAEDRS